MGKSGGPREAISIGAASFSQSSFQALRSHTWPGVTCARAGLSWSKCKLRCRRTALFLTPALPPPQSAQIRRGQAAKGELSRANPCCQAGRTSAGGGPCTRPARSPKTSSSRVESIRCCASQKLPRLKEWPPTSRWTRGNRLAAHQAFMVLSTGLNRNSETEITEANKANEG